MDTVAVHPREVGMRAKSLRRAILGVAALLVLPGALLAQSGTGTIDGRVHDESRAPLPGRP